MMITSLSRAIYPVGMCQFCKNAMTIAYINAFRRRNSEKSLRNLIKSNRNQIVFTDLQTEGVRMLFQINRKTVCTI